MSIREQASTGIWEHTSVGIRDHDSLSIKEQPSGLSRIQIGYERIDN